MLRNKMNFEGKIAIVSGGTQGIGKAICELLQEKGCNVITTGRKIDPKRLKNKNRLKYLPLDLLDHKSIASFVKIVKDLKRVDILINNAGINIIESIDEINEENWNNIMKVNLTGPMLLIKAIAPYMKKNNSGKILNVSSIWGISSKEKRAAYSASKSGLLGLTRTASLELASYNVLVNAICPGFTMTDLTKSTLTEPEIEDLSKQIPLGRFANTREIAEVAVFLCSDLNTYITGQTITVDGGFTIG